MDGAGAPGGQAGAMAPSGDAYDWYRRGCALLAQGDAGAAAELLARVVAHDPGSRSGWESLARARFDSRQYPGAADAFAHLIAVAPDDDYAQFGLGLSLWRLADFAGASEHLALAVAMRPDRAEYTAALRQVRATRRARGEIPPETSPEPGAAP